VTQFIQQESSYMVSLFNNSKARVLVVIFLLSGLLFSASAAQANDIYLAQSSTGAGNGGDCGDALPYSWFNSSSNWGNGGNQIGPGTIVHLCGRISGPAGSTGLTFQGSGTSGNPITLLFENGADLASSQWGNAISSSGRNFITIDGGANGVIENTANGSNLSNQGDSNGIYVSGGSSIEIKNLIIRNIYVHSPGGSDGQNSAGIRFEGSPLNNISVHNNTINDARSGIIVAFYSLNGANMYDNTIYNICWGIPFLDGNNGSSATAVQVHDNDIHDFINWWDANFEIHFDGIMFATTNPNTSFTNSSIYNNYLHGPMDGNGTGYIYLTGSSGGMSGITVYNNLIYSIKPTSGDTRLPEALIVLGFHSQSAVLNNTLVSVNPGIKIRDGGTTVTAIKNNIFSGSSEGAMYCAIVNQTETSLTGMNDNDYYNLGNLHQWIWGDGKIYYNSLSSWRSGCNCDSNSVVGDPKLDANFHPQSGSAAIGIGGVLPSTAVAALGLDKDQNARPSGGPWDSGAYESGVTATKAPAPPSGLKAQVQ
jgi:hypothetical protein